MSDAINGTPGETVKRYAFRLSQLSEVMGGRLEVVEYSGDGLPYVLAADYDSLEAECERLRMQLAACGVVALSNTPESAAQARQMHPDYMSASCSDVADAVDREMALRQQRDALAAELAAIKGQELDGWRLVPVEPTAEMLAAAWAAPIPAVWLDSISARDNLVQITKYRAMLAAAPSMPDAQVAPVGKHAHLYECTGCGVCILRR